MLQRKNHENGLLQIEGKYKDIFSHSPIGIELYDLKGKLIEVNPACLDIFGVRSIEDVRGFDLFRDPNLPVDARERLLRGETVSYEAAFDFERVKQMGLYPTDKSGQRFIDVHIHPFQGTGKHPGGFLVYVKDVTERARTLEELEKYRDHLEELVRQRTRELGDTGRKYRTVADFTYDWEDWSNPDGSFVYVSPSCERISGHRPQEFIERPYLFREIIVAEDRVFWDRHFSGVRHQLKPAETQFRVRRRDGEVCWIEHACQPIKDAAQNVIGFLSSNRDITERKLLEQKIQKSAEEWQTTFDSIQDPIMVLDPEFRILRINAATRSFLGLPDDQILGACCYELVHGTEGCMPECPVQTILTSKHHEEMEVYEPGRGIWLHIAADPLLDPSESLIGIVHTLKDITPRRKAEEDLQQLQEELRRVTRIATMGELTAALAHELNQPLTGILSNAEAAQQLLSAPNPDLTELKEILSDIIEDDQRASEVISKLRSLFKKDVLKFEPLDLNAVIQDLAPMIRSHALLKGVAFVTELDPENLPVVGDRIQLQQVMLNLAFNGFEAMEPSAIKTLRIRTGRTDGKWVTVSVEDSGPGINPKKKEEIFKPFFTTKEDGMGIGLAVSHSIIRLHQGRIWIENNPDRGATVSFTLPLANERLE